MPWVNVEKIPESDPADSKEIREVEDCIRRKSKPRFYADENFPPSAIETLRSRGADVITVKEVQRLGHPDENHAAEALRLGRILITCDRDYLDNRRFPLLHCPALVVCDFGTGTIEEIGATFCCLWSAFTVPRH